MPCATAFSWPLLTLLDHASHALTEPLHAILHLSSGFLLSVWNPGVLRRFLDTLQIADPYLMAATPSCAVPHVWIAPRRMLMLLPVLDPVLVPLALEQSVAGEMLEAGP